MTAGRPTLGGIAPEVEFLDGDGRPWRLSEQRGSVVVLIFHRHIH
jgi:peroxiredoxin